MGKACAAMVLIAGWLGASACPEDTGLSRLPEPPFQIDALKQKPAAQVDILWVVDNSGSMVDEQNLLAENFREFINGLTICQGTGVANDVCDPVARRCQVSGLACNPPDYHIGVISTDVVASVDQGRLRRVGLCVAQRGGSPADGKYKYCAGSNTHCTAEAEKSDPAYDARNRVCDMSQSLAFMTPTTPGAANAFSRAVRVGTQGSGRESGIQAAAMALGRHWDRDKERFVPAPAENGQFLRAEASLFLIFVSDEDDATFGEVTYFYRTLESVKSAGNEALVSASAIVGDPDPDGNGPVEGGCPKGADVPIAAPGTRYVGLAMYSRGLSAEFRVCDGQRLVCPEGSQCHKPITGFPSASTELGLCVPSAACAKDQDCGNFQCTGGSCVKCDGAKKCSATPESFIELLGKNGIFGSICAEDYQQVLGALGFEAAGLRRKFELTKPPDCFREVDCGATPARVCVKVNGQVVPNERATGWVWEGSSNSIFFDGDFVPPTDAAIEVSYRVAPASSSLGCDAALK